MGGKGSGGFNKKTIEQHIKDGTYRADRHGPINVKLAAKLETRLTRKERTKLQPVRLSAKTTPITCPGWFDEIAKDEFSRVCQLLYNNGTLADVNHATLEGYCVAYSKAVRAEHDLNDGFEETITMYNSRTGEPYTVKKRKTAVAVAEKAWHQVRIFALELGITVAMADKGDKRSEAEKFLDAMSGKTR